MVGAMKSPKLHSWRHVKCTHSGIISNPNEILQLAIPVRRNKFGWAQLITKHCLPQLGRVDLTQAEAVMDIIRAKTDKAMNIAVKQLDQTLSDLINNTRQEILNTLAQVELYGNYPEYDDVEEATTAVIREKNFREFEHLLTNLLKTARRGKILHWGVCVRSSKRWKIKPS